MKSHNISVTVGLSAYNEEKNISGVLTSILKQKRFNWVLKEILVYCDGCTDNTVTEINKIHTRLIRIKDDGKRKGKVARVEELCHDAKGDVLFIFDCDLIFKDDQVINHMIEPYTKDKKTVLVGGNTRPMLPKTFVEKAVYSTFLVFDRSRRLLKNGNNVFGCTGGCLSVRTSFGRMLKFPPVLNEDDFMYFSTIKAGYEFKHIRESIVYYKLPTNIPDYLRQIFRSNPESVTLNFGKYFDDLPMKEYKRGKFFYANAIFRSFLVYPIETLFIIMVNFLSKPFFPLIAKRYKISWYTAKSTK